MSQLPILTLTLNPALDMATEVHELIPGHKLRCTEPLLDPGGGGLNVSRAIKSLGGDSLALVAIGGLTGTATDIARDVYHPDVHPAARAARAAWPTLT